jgi:hypothetical protein
MEKVLNPSNPKEMLYSVTAFLSTQKYTGLLPRTLASQNLRLISNFCVVAKVKGKTIPLTGHEGPSGCETSRLPHFLDNQLTDGGKVVRLTRRPPFTPQEDSWYSFLLEAEPTPGP